MKIVVNKCPDTGELFESDTEYKNHRRRLLAEKKRIEEYELRKDSTLNWIADEKLKIQHTKEIGPWVLDNQARLMEACNEFGQNCFSFSERFDKKDKFTKFELIRMTYSDLVSNSHSSPKGKPQNWSCRPDLPRGYPGWAGRIEGSLERPSNKQSSYPYGAICKFIGLHTGTGGGGNKSWGYDLRIYLEEWPGLINNWADIEFDRQVEEYREEQERVIRRLKGGRRYY